MRFVLDLEKALKQYNFVQQNRGHQIAFENKNTYIFPLFSMMGQTHASPLKTWAPHQALKSICSHPHHMDPAANMIKFFSIAKDTEFSRLPEKVNCFSKW